MGDFEQYFSAVVNDVSGSNGGDMCNDGYNDVTENAIPVNDRDNVFSDVTEEQRIAGVTQYRKVYHKSINGPTANMKIHLVNQRPGSEIITLIDGTVESMQCDAEAGQNYGLGVVEQVSDHGTHYSICVTIVAPYTLGIFGEGMTVAVILADTTTYYAELFYAATEYNVNPPWQRRWVLQYYSSAGALPAIGDIISSCIVTSGASEYVPDNMYSNGEKFPLLMCCVENLNNPWYPVLPYSPCSTEYDIWTVTTLATLNHFNITGLYHGDVGNSVFVSSGWDTFSPGNPNRNGLPYFDFPRYVFKGLMHGAWATEYPVHWYDWPDGAWEANWVAGRSAIFSTRSAVYPSVWRQRVIPPNTPARFSGGYTIRTSVESMA